jgi:hypothetical protein
MTRHVIPHLAATVVALAAILPAGAQSTPAVEGFHRAFDQLLDLYVRDGFVYYAAVRSEREALDRYVASLDGPAVAQLSTWPREEQAAFWVNAYNAIVIRTVIDHYPIRGRSPAYPPNSIRQVPGAFERLTRRVAGRAVTLDAIEKEILSGFSDPRLYLALGRGAVGSGRLRSEAYAGGRLEKQLEEAAREFVTRNEMFSVDQPGARVSVTPIVGWREQDFIAAYAGRAAETFASRSPIERAIVAFVRPFVLPSEARFLDRNEFALRYHDFDWRLNDLTGGRR